MSKVVAVLGILVGSLATIFEVLVAAGVNITPDQQTTIAAVAGMVLAVLSAYFHPTVKAKLTRTK